jgi:hypothetical protein
VAPAPKCKKHEHEQENLARELLNRRHVAAVNVEQLAGEVARGVGAKENHGADQVPRARRSGQDFFQHRGAPGRVLMKGLGELRAPLNRVLKHLGSEHRRPP